MTNLEAQLFNNSARYALMLAEQLQQQAVRENILKLVRVWLATARDAEDASDIHVEGYGFIERDQGGDIFVHISEVDENFDTLAKGQRVSFEEGASRRTCRPEAKNVTVIEASVERVRRYG